MPASFPSAALLQTAQDEGRLAQVLASTPFQDLLTADFRALPPKVDEANSLFSQLAAPVIQLLSFGTQIAAWEVILRICQAADPSRYEATHKGTPFYFVGMASFMGRDFEKALHYMDAALGEDIRIDPATWPSTPAGLFVLLDDTPTTQAARELVTTINQRFQQWSSDIAAAGGRALSTTEYRQSFVTPSINGGGGRRSLVTAFLSYVLEFRGRQLELQLVPASSTTGESVYLHLFKGALLFESLLRTSAEGAMIVAKKPKATIDDFLKTPAIFKALGFTSAPQGLGGDTLDDVFSAIAADASSRLPYSIRAVRAAWGLRNKTGHNLAWPARPTRSAHAEAAQLLFCAHSNAIAALW